MTLQVIELSNFAPADYIDETCSGPGVFLYKGAGCYIVQYNVLTNESKSFSSWKLF